MLFKDRLWFRAALVMILGTAVFGSTFRAVRHSGDYAFFEPLIDIKVLLGQRYVDDLDEEAEKAMQVGAINGMLEALNDPYTVYVPPAERREFDKGLLGEYVGIGALVFTQDGWLTVASPLEDSPAFKAGVMADDRVVEIAGESTYGKTSDECVDLLSGEVGTPVNILVERNGERIPIEIVRQKIITKTVKGSQRADDEGHWQHFMDQERKIAYIRLTQFTPSSADEIEDLLESLGAREGEVGGIVFDLRWNPGGLLNSAIDIADLFVDEGAIVSTRGRSESEDTVRATKSGTMPRMPIAILLNGQSASASEVFSGALVDNDRAIAVGTRSFGKGLVQTVIGLPSGNGSQLKMTEQRYYLPSGRSIHRMEDAAEWGVDPTDGFHVAMTNEETRELLRLRREGDIIRSGGNGTSDEWSDPEWITEHAKDKQLAAALKAVQLRIDEGEWVATGGENPVGNEQVAQELSRLELGRERMIRELGRLSRRIEELEVAAGDAEDVDLRDFWSDEAEVTGGQLQVFDKDGNLVATLDITGPNLERWLIDADVEPQQAEDGQ